MNITTINRFIRLFADAFAGLQVKVSMDDIERLAMLVHSAMESKRRAYHTSIHVFNMCRGMEPRQVLAALFHDVVYYQLDGGFPKQSAYLLAPVARLENGALVLNTIPKRDKLLRLCVGLFAFKAGEPLPVFGGMNEFLSAVVAARLLEPCLPVRDLIAIIACIAATVPFCRPDDRGRSYAEVLAGRVRDQSRKRLGKSDEAQVARTIREAIKIANRDVNGFAEPNPAKFLAQTWLLIEESNAPLEAVGLYTLQDYRLALSRMEKFLSELTPECIFRQYDGFPSDARLARLKEAARKNLVFAVDYLDAKIVSTAVAEAMARETGGNGPVSMFLGDLRSPFGKPTRVEDFLPAAKTVADIQPLMLQVFEKGRAQESRADLNTSPLTAYIYRSIGHEGMKEAFRQAKRMFAGELSALGYLRTLDREVVLAIAVACARIAISRRERLSKLQKRLGK